uniref:Methylosome subunit pICln n=1 Tax=Ascaris lumbricoides TaxID=6252 RepID=A0A0M3IPL2_ASCLU
MSPISLVGDCAQNFRLCFVLFTRHRSVTWICSQSHRGFSLTYPSIILHAISRDDSVFPDECLYVLVDATKNEGRQQRRQPEIIFTDISDDFGSIGLSGVDDAAEASVSSDLNVESAAGVSHNGQHAEAIEDDDDDEEDKTSEVAIRFIPHDKSILPQLYQQMCECQALNPDENDDFSDEFGEEEELTETRVGEHVGQGDGPWFTSETEGEPEMSAEGMANLQRIMAASQRHLRNGNNEDEEEEQMDE